MSINRLLSTLALIAVAPFAAAQDYSGQTTLDLIAHVPAAPCSISVPNALVGRMTGYTDQLPPPVCDRAKDVMAQAAASVSMWTEIGLDAGNYRTPDITPAVSAGQPWTCDISTENAVDNSYSAPAKKFSASISCMPPVGYELYVTVDGYFISGGGERTVTLKGAGEVTTVLGIVVETKPGSASTCVIRADSCNIFEHYDGGSMNGISVGESETINLVSIQSNTLCSDYDTLTVRIDNNCMDAVEIQEVHWGNPERRDVTDNFSGDGGEGGSFWLRNNVTNPTDFGTGNCTQRKFYGPRSEFPNTNTCIATGQ